MIAPVRSIHTLPGGHSTTAKPSSAAERMRLHRTWKVDVEDPSQKPPSQTNSRNSEALCRIELVLDEVGAALDLVTVPLQRGAHHLGGVDHARTCAASAVGAAAD